MREEDLSAVTEQATNIVELGTRFIRERISFIVPRVKSRPHL
jgi:hypothetical protein